MEHKDVYIPLKTQGSYPSQPVSLQLLPPATPHTAYLIHTPTPGQRADAPHVGGPTAGALESSAPGRERTVRRTPCLTHGGFPRCEGEAVEPPALEPFFREVNTVLPVSMCDLRQAPSPLWVGLSISKMRGSFKIISKEFLSDFFLLPGTGSLRKGCWDSSKGEEGMKVW